MIQAAVCLRIEEIGILQMMVDGLLAVLKCLSEEAPGWPIGSK
jgi:hypothetical protein